MKVDFNLKLQSEPGLSEATPADAPFLSIITRTQGRRPHTLVEVLTCLAAQSDTDFEVLLVGHRLDLDCSALVLGLVEDCPSWLRRRIRFISVQDGTRTRPLQVGLAAARGAFVALLDDDDIIFAHWVERFRSLSQAMPGRVLRSNTVVQLVETVSVQGLAGLRADASPEVRYPKIFNFFGHVLGNSTPPVTLAFPRQLIEREGIEFDEMLTTTEDWDFFMRCAGVCGVANASEITSVYRWWKKGESSRTVHCEAEWQKNHDRIWNNWDAAGFRLPPGSMREFIEILQEHTAFGTELRSLQAQIALDAEIWCREQEEVALRLEQDRERDLEHRLMTAKVTVQGILNSTCWRLTRPLRRIGLALTGGGDIDATALQNATLEQAEALVLTLYRSRSWRLAWPVRLVSRLLGGFPGFQAAAR